LKPGSPHAFCNKEFDVQGVTGAFSKSKWAARPGQRVLDPKVVVDEVRIRILVVLPKFDRLNRNRYELNATIRPILPPDNGAFVEHRTKENRGYWPAKP
jgi:hypothetical protein